MYWTLVTLVCFCVASWCFYQLRRPVRLKKLGREIHAAVVNHLQDGYSQARPIDTPGADPDTKFIQFGKTIDGSVVITRVDWHDDKRWYVITADGSIGRPPPPDQYRNRSDRRWYRSQLTHKRCKKILAAVTHTYLPAMSRHKGDAPPSNNFTLAC